MRRWTAVAVAVWACGGAAPEGATEPAVEVSPAVQSDAVQSADGGTIAVARPETLCDATETVAYSCTTTSGKLLSICSSPDFDAERGWVQYRFGKSSAVELAYPGDKRGSQKAFVYTRYTRPQFTELTLSFRNGGAAYVVYSASGEEGSSDEVRVYPKGNLDDSPITIACSGDVDGSLMSLENKVLTKLWGEP